MHILDIFHADSTTFSFEFFPPKTDHASEELFGTIAQLQASEPSFVSVTYGAGRPASERMIFLWVRITRDESHGGFAPDMRVPWRQVELAAILDRYAASGVEQHPALGGDPPRNKPNYDRSHDAFQYADQLVRFIREQTGPTDPRGFGIGVAGFPEGHPGTPNRLQELDYLKRKIDAGSDYICTQLFFVNHDLYDFRERCELAGITVPIIAGIMPVTSNENMSRMAELALGSNSGRLPAPSTGAEKTLEAVAKVGVHWATEQCRDLLDNQVRGLHF